MARAPRLIALAATALVAAACAAAPAAGPADHPSSSVRLLFVGDAMLGRGVGAVLESEGPAVFEDIRSVIRGADVAAVNVESPLTRRPHISANPYAIEADPSAAAILADAGFDVASIANNHAGDAGPQSVVDTLEALETVGIAPVGGGRDLEGALAPRVVDVGGISVAFMAFDVSGDGLAATATRPGIVAWDADRARATIEGVRRTADVVVASIHGGVEYFGDVDPFLRPVADLLAVWGVDIVWGQGPHVEQPIEVTDPDGDGRPTIIATSLGNFVFDQWPEETSGAPILEVLVDSDGVVAHRIGDEDHRDLHVHFRGWRTPEGAAAVLAGSWWSIDRPVRLQRNPGGADGRSLGDVVALSSGDLDGDGTDETLVSYRHAAVERPWDRGLSPPVDEQGRTAHLGVLDGGEAIWLSRRPPHPVGDVAACDGSAAFAFTTLDDGAVIATGGGAWSGFGFTLAAELPGGGTIGCVDLDGDGRTEPAVIGR